MIHRPRRSSREILIEALTHLELAQQYAAGDADDQRTVDAICMRLSAGIESLSRLDDTAREVFFGQTWTAMWGMRNRIAHGYLLIDPSIVRSTIDRDLPRIIARTQEALEQLP